MEQAGWRLIEEAEDLASGALPSRLLVVHDAVRRAQHDVAELARREQIVDPLLDVLQLKVEARADHAALVDTARQLDHDLRRAVVVDDLKLADVAWSARDEARARRQQDTERAGVSVGRDPSYGSWRACGAVSGRDGAFTHWRGEGECRRAGVARAAEGCRGGSGGR